MNGVSLRENRVGQKVAKDRKGQVSRVKTNKKERRKSCRVASETSADQKIWGQ